MSSRPGKRVIWYATQYWGLEEGVPDIRQFYDYPKAFGLVGKDTKEMLEKVAKFFNYPGGARALDAKVCEHSPSKMENW